MALEGQGVRLTNFAEVARAAKPPVVTISPGPRLI
jgi:hypothetical protein